MLVYNCINGGGSVLILATIFSTFFAGEGQFIIVVLFFPLKPTHNVQIFCKYFANFCFWNGISNLFKANFASPVLCFVSLLPRMEYFVPAYFSVCNFINYRTFVVKIKPESNDDESARQWQFRAFGWLFLMSF